MLSMGCTSGKESLVLKNRKRTLKKKASELSTLCGAEVCMVFMDDNGNLDVWPEDAEKAKATIIKYNNILQSRPAKKPKTTTSSRAAGYDDEFGIIPSCCFDTNNPDLIPNNNCNMGMVNQFDQFQPSLPLAATMDFSDTDRATMTASSGSESESLSNNYNNIIDDDHNDQITCVGPIGGFDDEFEIIPRCCFDDFDMNNPDDHITNNCHTVMVYQFDQFQPSLPLADDMNNPDLVPNNKCNMGIVDQFDQFQQSLPLATAMDFSDRDRATMAASSGSESQSLSNNYNNIIVDDHNDQITCDDEFEVIPSCYFDEFYMNNPDDHITNNCHTVMVDQFDQFQPSLPLATALDFSDRDRATMAASSGSESESLSNNYNNIIVDDHNDQITCVGSIDGFDDEFDVIPNCYFDEFDMNNPHDHITNNCHILMVDQFDQFQPSLPVATMDFSDRDRATMAAHSEFSDRATMATSGSESESLSNNYNDIIDDATWDYFTDDVGNTTSFDDDPSDQYWNNHFGGAAGDTDSDLGCDLLYFLMEDKREICN